MATLRVNLPRKHRLYPVISLMAGIVAIARIVATTHVFSDTIDEPYHIASAVVLWEAKQLTVGAQHPPLARWVIGLPLVMQGLHLPDARGEYVVTEYPAFGIGNDLLFSGKLPYWKILTAARHSLLIFTVIALFYVYRIGRYFGGARVGMLATVFFSFDPTFLAHSGMVGTDVAGCAGFLAGFYYCVQFVAKPQAARGVAAGIATGLALGCKFSCLLLIPTIVLIVAARWIISRKRIPRFKFIALACALAFVLLWATYGFAINQMRQQAIFTDEPVWTRLPNLLQQQPIPMPSFFLGQMLLAHRTASGHATYMNGSLSFDGWRSYFFEALLLKEPVGFLLALVSASIIFACRWRSLRSIILLIPIVIYLAISMRSHYQLGIRHLLPILPLMYIFGVMQFARLRLTGPLLAMIVLAGIETAAIHPDYLAFFNFASGGTTRGDRYLIDSNLDWGQDIYRLSNWLHSDAVRGRAYTIRCAYTNDQMLKEFGLDPAARTAKPHGLFAISKDVERGLTESGPNSADTAPTEDYSWVWRYPLVKHIGYSIDVFDLDAKDVQAKP